MCAEVNEEIALKQLEECIARQLPLEDADKQDDTALDLALRKRLKKIFCKLISCGSREKIEG